jgi:serine/alanine adding enzyme
MARFEITQADDSSKELWDQFVLGCEDASLFHLFGWKKVIKATYGHAAYYLMLTECDALALPTAGCGERHIGVVGVLPLFHLDHAVFGKALVSLPFTDGGGILANSKAAQERLLNEAIELGRRLGVKTIDLRQEHPVAALEDLTAECTEKASGALHVTAGSNRYRLLLELPESSKLLMKSFKSKLRSQIMKPIKSGLTSKEGGAELLEDFYRVFLVNMRDLGSPVHSPELMRNVLAQFPDCSRIICVYKDDVPVAAALVVGFNGVLRNPWASSLRKHASLSPNMLLYLRMLEYACDHGYRSFDFGRSTRGEGTFRFKEQWGAKPLPLVWHELSLEGSIARAGDAGKSKFEMAMRCWQKLPVGVTKRIGPVIRKHISL